jgi:WD40 repeat protein
MSGKVERLADHLPCALYRGLADITRDGRLLACLHGENRQSVTIIALDSSPAYEIGRLILPEPAISVSWSPDGHMLAVATSLNHRASAIHLYAIDDAQSAYALKEILVFPPAVLSRHAGDDPGIDGIAWSPDGRYLALHVSGGITTDYQTLLALSDLGPPDATVDLPIPAGALTVPAVTITHLQDLAAPPRQRLLVWAPSSDALLVLANDATLARLDIASGKLTTILALPDPPATVRGKITAFATFPADDRVAFVYSASWNAFPSERVYVYTPAA